MAKSKNVEIRLYRRHDLDLIMLKAYGLSVTKMMRMALLNYVDGERIKFRLPDARPFDVGETTCVRYRLSVSDPRIIRLLENIKIGYRNQFCKQLLRDFLDSAPLGVYLSDSYIKYESNRINADAQVEPMVVVNLKENKKSEKTSTQKEKVNKKLEKIAKEETLDVKKSLERDNIPEFVEMSKEMSVDESIPDLFEHDEEQTTIEKHMTSPESIMSMFSEMVSEGKE